MTGGEVRHLRIRRILGLRLLGRCPLHTKDRGTLNSLRILGKRTAVPSRIRPRHPKAMVSINQLTLEWRTPRPPGNQTVPRLVPQLVPLRLIHASHPKVMDNINHPTKECPTPQLQGRTAHLHLTLLDRRNLITSRVYHLRRRHFQGGIIILRGHRSPRMVELILVVRLRHLCRTSRRDLVRTGISNLLSSNSPRIRGITHLPVPRRILGTLVPNQVRHYHLVSVTILDFHLCAL